MDNPSRLSDADGKPHTLAKGSYKIPRSDQPAQQVTADDGYYAYGAIGTRARPDPGSTDVGGWTLDIVSMSPNDWVCRWCTPRGANYGYAVMFASRPYCFFCNRHWRQCALPDGSELVDKLTGEGFSPPIINDRGRLVGPLRYTYKSKMGSSYCQLRIQRIHR